MSTLTLIGPPQSVELSRSCSPPPSGVQANADGYNFKQLQAEILKLSNAKDWPSARREWKLSTVYNADQNQTCLCGHHPIREICVIRNEVNGNQTEVGN